MKRNIVIIIATVLLAIGLRFAFSYIMSGLKQKAMKNRPAPTVEIETIKSESVTESFEAPGRVVSKYRVSILARISGYLQKSFFKEGDYVKAGDILFLIEPAEYQNAANAANADMREIQARLDYANKQLVRAGELLKQDYIAKSRYDEILAERDSLSARLNAAKSNYGDTKRNLDYTEVKAPVDGRIGFIDVSVGNYVSPASGSLTTINSTNPIYVTFPLSTEDYVRLSETDKTSKKTRKTELYLQNGIKYEYDGVQDFIDNKADQTTGSVTMRATFQNPENKLLHGEFVKVILYANSPVKVPLVPAVAVMENQEGKYVYSIDENGLPKLTRIKVRGRSGENFIVSEGLKEGDKVITAGIQKVTPGQPVTLLKTK